MTQISGSSHHNHGTTTYRGRSSLTTWSLDFDVSNYSKKRRRNRSFRCFLTVSFVITAVLLLTLPFIFSKFETSRLQLPVHSHSKQDTSHAKTKTSIQLQTGEVLLVQGVETIPIPYYHQPSLAPTEENYHLVLLHGAAFTKEDWKTSGIFDSFSKTFPSIAITALDLPVKADHNDLKQVLGKLRDEDLIEQLPISALVTPSASGKSITTWIADTDDNAIDELEVYLSLWIPVASFSVASLTTTNLQALQQQEHVNVLAIYGDKDVRGKKVMSKLRDHAGAKLVELHGRHPVYLDSPDDFVMAVGEQLTMK